MKRLFSSTLILAILVATTACGSGGANTDQSVSSIVSASTSVANPSSADSQGAVKELTMLGVAEGMEWATFISQAAAPFEQKNNVKIIFTATTSADFLQQFMAMTNSGAPLDVMRINGQDARFLTQSKFLMNLKDYTSIDTDIFLGSALAPYTFDDGIYAIPFDDATGSGLYYNNAIFEANGLTPPKTYDELLAVSKTLKSKGIIPIAFGGQSKYMWPMWFFQTLGQQCAGKTFDFTMQTLRGEVKWTDAKYVEAMRGLEALAKADLFQPGVNGTDTTGGESIFISEKAAMFYGGTWNTTNFVASGLDGKLGITLYPLIKEGNAYYQTGALGGTAIAGYSKAAEENKKMIAEFAAFLSNSDNTRAKMLFQANGDEASISGLSIRKDVKFPETPIMTKIKTDILPVTETFLDWYWPPEITVAFQDEIQAVIGLKRTPEQAMDNIQKVFDGLVTGGYTFK
jgi:raffinose/stachyose/melibiose transport system substrate-binding protein